MGAACSSLPRISPELMSMIDQALAANDFGRFEQLFGPIWVEYRDHQKLSRTERARIKALRDAYLERRINAAARPQGSAPTPDQRPRDADAAPA